MLTISLHIIAAILWGLALMMAMGAGNAHALKQRDRATSGVAITLLIAVVAFILQVIA